MATSETTKAADTSLLRDLAHAARYHLGNRRALIILAVVAIAGGAALNWNWLVAAGIAPILVGVLPCLLMCGLGLCMHKMVGGMSASQPAQLSTTEPTAQSLTSAAAPTNNVLAGVSSCCGGAADARPAKEPPQAQALDERRTPHG